MNDFIFGIIENKCTYIPYVITYIASICTLVGSGMTQVWPVLFSTHHTLLLLSGDYYSVTNPTWYTLLELQGRSIARSFYLYTRGQCLSIMAYDYTIVYVCLLTGNYKCPLLSSPIDKCPSKKKCLVYKTTAYVCMYIMYVYISVLLQKQACSNVQYYHRINYCDKIFQW